MIRTLLPLLLLAPLAAGEATGPGGRRLLVACAADADPAVRALAERIRTAETPLLAILAGGAAPLPLADSRALAAAPAAERARHHVIAVGPPDDPLVRQAWQHEAKSEPAGWYAFGFGLVAGPVGWLEAGPSPWLHSAAIAKPPYETQAITVTGNGTDGILAAGEALVTHGLVNGPVARSGWTRPQTTLLDRDPLVGDPGPLPLPERHGEWRRLALSLCGADVARGILADGGMEPQVCWLAKYYRPGVWDEAGGAAGRRMYLAGLHRRAFANAVLLARFADAAEAARALPGCTGASKLQPQGDGFAGKGHGIDGEQGSEVPMAAWTDGPWLIVSTVPGGRWR